MADFYKALVMRELLPALDNIERSLLHVPKDLKGHDYIKGVQSVVKQFEKVFSDIGVQRIKTVGEHFNPELHEAIGIKRVMETMKSSVKNFKLVICWVIQ